MVRCVCWGWRHRMKKLVGLALLPLLLVINIRCKYRSTNGLGRRPRTGPAARALSTAAASGASPRAAGSACTSTGGTALALST